MTSNAKLSSEILERNVEERNDELIALESMYGDDEIECSTGSRKRFEKIAENVYQVSISIDATHALICEFTLPSSYPSNEPPSILFQASWVDKEIDLALQAIEVEMKDMFQPGAVVLFEWIELLLDPDTFATVRSLLEENSREREGSSRTGGKHSYFEMLKEAGFTVYRSEEPLMEKDSKFIAHAAVNIRSLAQIRRFMEILLSDKKYERATHSMFAYRFEELDSTLHENRDDDGEGGAGDVLLKLLQQLNAKNILIVVTRWYGGTLLGPKRFRVIASNALTLLQSIPRNQLLGEES